MKICRLIATLCVVAMVITGVTTKLPLTTDLKIRYFTSTTLICDHQSLNISHHPDTVASISWIFPDGSVVDADSHLNPKRYTLQAPGPHVTLTADQQVTFAPYNLTVLDVNDDVFGIYICMVVYKTNGIEAIRYGLNVDGADFSELMKQYEHNAIVGGVAAAAMLVLVGGACLVWNYRFAKRHFPDDDDDADETDEKKEYSNEGFKSDIELSRVDVGVASEQGNAELKTQI